MFGDLCTRETVPSMTHALDRAPIDKTRKGLRVNAGRDSLARREDASTSERPGNGGGRVLPLLRRLRPEHLEDLVDEVQVETFRDVARAGPGSHVVVLLVSRVAPGLEKPLVSAGASAVLGRCGARRPPACGCGGVSPLGAGVRPRPRETPRIRWCLRSPRAVRRGYEGFL